MTSYPKVSQRLEYVDVVRGAAIIAVIVGHTIPDSFFRAVIYSVHMPLFFVTSGFLGKKPENAGQMAKSARKGFFKLIVTAVVLFFVRSLIFAAINKDGFSFLWAVRAVFMGSVEPVPHGMLFEGFAPIGIVWFSFALFGSKLIWNAITLIKSTRVEIILALVVSVYGVVIGRLQWFPFAFDLGMAVVVFMLAGNLMKNRVDKKSDPVLLAVSGAIWFVLFSLYFSFTGKQLDIANRVFAVFPVSYVCAIAGTVFFLELGKFICERIPAGPLRWLGRNSIVVYYVHYMDDLIRPLWSASENKAVSCAIRIAFVAAVSAAVIYLAAWIRSLFGGKENARRSV